MVVSGIVAPKDSSFWGSLTVFQGMYSEILDEFWNEMFIVSSLSWIVCGIAQTREHNSTSSIITILETTHKKFTGQRSLFLSLFFCGSPCVWWGTFLDNVKVKVPFATAFLCLRYYRWFLRCGQQNMSGGNQESSKYHDASYLNSSVWRVPNFWLHFVWRCYDGCFCFSWLPLIFNKVFFFGIIQTCCTQKDGWNRVMKCCIYAWMKGSWIYRNTKGSWNDPTAFKKFWRGHIWSTKIHGFIAFNACLAEAHSSLLVYTWRWESYRSCDGKVMVTFVADPVGWISPRYYLPIGSFKWHI